MTPIEQLVKIRAVVEQALAGERTPENALAAIAALAKYFTRNTP